ncbi:hypothetical protein NE865_09087 [Phthorimaea operculella]|nr:hypothetical protein NE865_09087 [Phthorimaea operculella]
MASLNLSGLPSNTKLPKLVIVLKSMLKREGIIKFWVKEMSDIRGTDLKSARVEFYSGDEAYRALTAIDGFEFSMGQTSYPITASLDEEERRRPRRRSPSPYIRRPREREYRDRYEEPSYRSDRYDGYSRERSRSPVHRDSSKLDLEIELLRKQRMIIEEERRLLLERKKLELVKEFGPSALKEFKSFEDDRERDRRYRPERPAEYRPRRRSPPPPPRGKPAPPRQWGQKGVQLPQFHVPCKAILEELKELMEKLGTRKESFLLTKLIRATIRKRIAVLLEGKPIMPAPKIVALYREKYPNHQDEDFVKKHLKDIRACHMPTKGNDKASVKAEEKAETVEEEKEGQEKNGDDEKADEGTQEQDKEPDGADIKAETNEPEPAVKEEPNTSTDTQVLETQNESAETEGEYSGIPGVSPIRLA